MPEIVSYVIDVYPFRRTPAGPQFLLLKRNPNIRLGGTWQAVHGKIEPGETATQAALRELREETGLKPRAFWQIDSVNTFYLADRDRVLMCPGFAADIDPETDVVLSGEHTDSRWADVEETLQTLMWPGQRRAVREILEEIITPSAAELFLRIPLD